MFLTMILAWTNQRIPDKDSYPPGICASFSTNWVIPQPLKAHSNSNMYRARYD